MAYKDCSEKLYSMINNAPEEIRALMICLMPLAAAMEKKSNGVHKAAEAIETDPRH